MPSVSVIFFVRNAISTVDRALDSIISQNVPGLELIVLDGGSTDGTVERIRRHESMIAFWRSSPDGGSRFAIAEGIARASGEVISLLAADDWLEPGALETVVTEFSGDPELEVLSCGTRIVRFDDAGSMHVDAEFTSPAKLEFSLRKVIAHPLTCARFIRRSVYQRLGNHDPTFQFADYEFLVRICLAGVRARVNPRLAHTYRRHAGSDTFSGNPEMTFAMMRNSMRIASHYLGDQTLSADQRRALVRMHGWSSARCAAMFARHRRPAAALAVAREAIAVNPAWPLAVPFWVLRRLSDGIRPDR